MNLLPDKAIENRSITRQLTASLIITVLIVSVIAVSAMHRVVSQSALRGLEQKAEETLAYLAGSLEMPLWAVDEEGVKTIGEAVSHDESIVRLIIKNESGTVVYSMEKEYSGELIHRSGKIVHKQWSRDNPVGDLSLSLTPAIYKESNRHLLVFSMLIIVLILTTIGIVTVVFIRRSLNKPLKSLNEITSLFVAGIYDTSGHTLPYLEFQPFGRALAEMASKIEEQIRIVRKGEEDLNRMNERFVLATHAAQVGVWDWNIPKNELVWDDSMYRLYGIQKGDFGGAYDDWARTIHPQDKAHTEGEIQAALRGEREYAPEFRIVRPDGTIRYLKADSQTFRDEDGTPLRMVGANTDITERKQAEEERRESDARFRRIVDTATEGICSLGTDHMITFVNARMAEMLGCSSEEMASRPLTDFMFEEDAPDHWGKMEKRQQGLSENYERRFRRKNGDTVWTLASATPILDDEQHFQGSFAMFTDITERKLAEEELRRLKDDLEQRVQQRTAELKAKNEELQRLNQLFVGRELRMVELKEKIRKLEKEISGLQI